LEAPLREAGASGAEISVRDAGDETLEGDREGAAEGARDSTRTGSGARTGSGRVTGAE